MELGAIDPADQCGEVCELELQRGYVERSDELEDRVVGAVDRVDLEKHRAFDGRKVVGGMAREKHLQRGNEAESIRLERQAVGDAQTLNERT